MRNEFGAVLMTAAFEVDAGNTIVVEFEATAGQTVSVAIPTKEVALFTEKLGEALRGAAAMQARET
jgi:hypothetical protein